MGVVKYTLFVIILLTGQAAMAAIPSFGTSTESKYAREFSAPKNKAVIYIYQRYEDGSRVSPTIKLNNYVIGRLVPGSFTVWKLAPGRLELQVDGAKTTGVSIRAKAGRIYMFRLSVKQTSAGPEPQLSLMPDSDRNDLANTRLIKNPRSVTALAVKQPDRSVTPETKSTITSSDSEQVARNEPESKPKARQSPEYTSDAGVIPGNIGLMLKAGVFTLSEDSQLIVGADRSFDDSISPISIEAYYQYSSGLTLGGEIMSYSADFTTVGSNAPGVFDVLLIMGNVKKYFNTRSSVQPFIGAGIGTATADAGGILTGSTSGLAYQVVGGLEYRNSDIGIFGEAKYISADTDSDNNESIDFSGTGIFAGIAFHF